jgi:hypothetical protein
MTLVKRTILKVAQTPIGFSNHPGHYIITEVLQPMEVKMPKVNLRI